MLEGRRILVVEDDFLVALDLSEMVEARGATVIGPVGRLDQGLALAGEERLDGAILDINLGEETSLPLADRLSALSVPVIFATGYETPMLPERFADAPRLAKPFSDFTVERALREVFAGH